MINNLNIEQLAGELAGYVPELARDTNLNREEFIAHKIRKALGGTFNSDKSRAGIQHPTSNDSVSPPSPPAPLPQGEGSVGCAAECVKPLILERALVGFDIESTGTDVALDRIIQIAVVRIDPPDLFSSEERVTEKQWLVNPGIPIPPSSTRIHGITDAMVKDCPTFADVASEIHTWFGAADVTGYNIVNFDVPMLWEHFIREDIEWAVPKIVDASGIFQRKVPRNLTAALKRYCGRDHAKAHEAMADVVAAMDVLHGQRARYPDLAVLNVAGLAEFSTSEEYEGQPAKRLDLSGLIIEDSAGVARFTHKKVRGVAVADDIGYAEWLLNQSWLPQHTRRVLGRVLEQIENEL